MEQNYFSENESNYTKSSKSKKSVSLSTLIISLITTIVLILLIVNKWSTISSWIGIEIKPETIITSGLSIGDEIVLTGYIQSDGDITNYTHIISTSELGDIGLKSSTINLNKYTKEVYLEGVVEKFYLGTPIILVDVIYYVDMNDQELIEEVGDNSDWIYYESKYLPSVGLLLNPDFFSHYSLLNEGVDGVLKIKNNETNEIVEISYFPCSSSDNNKNCKKFNQGFSESTVQKVVDSYGIIYYKQPEVQSWFFSNDDFFGYFINDYSDDLVKSIIKDIQPVNKKFVEKNILNKVDLLCGESVKGKKTVTNSNIYFKDSKLFLDVEGKYGKDIFKCKLEVDPGLKDMAKMVDLEILGSEKDSLNTEDNPNIGNTELPEISYDRSSDVLQFPINVEKSLTFASRKGFSYVFPSSNIAYAAQNTQEDFSQLGVNCYSVMHVVQYSEKELVEQKANVKIYECTIKNGFDDSDQKLIYRQQGDSHFIIEIIDPARIQFAHNIDIEVSN